MPKSALQDFMVKKLTPKKDGEGDYEYLVIKVAELLKRIDPDKIKGKPGKDAPPVDERKIIKEVFKLVRQPKDGEPGKDGRTPTLEEIIPLIPKPIPGKDADEEKIINKVLSKIRVPKDGEDGEDAVIPDLRELAINTINLIESLEGEDRISFRSIRGIRNYVMEILRQGGAGVVFHDTTLSGSGVPGDPLSVKNPGSSTSFTDNEVISGSGTSWTLAHVPVLNSEHVFANGQRLIPAVDYTISNAIITTSLSWDAGTLLADYRTS